MAAGEAQSDHLMTAYIYKSGQNWEEDSIQADDIFEIFEIKKLLCAVYFSKKIFERQIFNNTE